MVSVTGLAVAPAMSSAAGCSAKSDYPANFRSPWGVNPGVNNNRLEITGGSF